MSGVIAYFLLLGGAFGVALALFFGLKAVKLI
ncbi:MAG: cytochrome b6-f complex subunit PetL [Aphanothece sp. CMT-3BRIN-NPC111]|jgi:cytochrome b6-f complex subunit 6|nr:cytochrome b6-f complex subunit PetL [Aphanothece sp. CMT-3BRIN-NPC111]